MTDLYLIADPKSKAEVKTAKRMDDMVKLIDQAEVILHQPVKDTEKIKALIIQMEEMGLKHWAKDLKNLIGE